MIIDGLGISFCLEIVTYEHKCINFDYVLKTIYLLLNSDDRLMSY